MDQKKPRPKGHRLRIGRQSQENGIYSITKVVHNRRPVLASKAAAKILTDSWQYLRANNRMKLLAFCVMPDHFHLLVGLMPSENLSKIIQDSSKFTARLLNRLHNSQGTFWQHGFHDHQCRNDQEVVDMADYIEHNPVRAGLVTSAEKWSYSSSCNANREFLDRDWFHVS